MEIVPGTLHNAHVVSDQPIIPEVLPPETDLPPELEALDHLAKLLDEAIEIPGTGKRIGLDPVAGLVPGLGDAIGAALSTWIIMGGLRHRVPARKIGRMIVNVLLDAGLGTIPLLGDVFDALFHQNVSNVKILLDHRRSDKPPRSLREVMAIGVAIFLVLLTISLGSTILMIWLLLKLAAALGPAGN